MEAVELSMIGPERTAQVWAQLFSGDFRSILQLFACHAPSFPCRLVALLPLCVYCVHPGADPSRFQQVINGLRYPGSAMLVMALATGEWEEALQAESGSHIDGDVPVSVVREVLKSTVVTATNAAELRRLRRDPSVVASVLRQLGNALYSRREWAVSGLFYSAGLVHEPNSVPLQTNLAASALLVVGHSPSLPRADAASFLGVAVHCCRAALAVDPGNLKAALRASQALRLLRREADSLMLLLRVIQGPSPPPQLIQQAALEREQLLSSWPDTYPLRPAAQYMPATATVLLAAPAAAYLDAEQVMAVAKASKQPVHMSAKEQWTLIAEARSLLRRSSLQAALRRIADDPRTITDVLLRGSEETVEGLLCVAEALMHPFFDTQLQRETAVLVELPRLPDSPQAEGRE